MPDQKSPSPSHTPEEGYVDYPVDTRIHTDQPDEPGALGGRPPDDRALEVVEGGIGMAAGLAVGTALAGPIGTVVGGIVGAAAGIAAGELLERRVGRVTTTTNATVPGGEQAADDEAGSTAG
jgi:hypothetical protein